jgi:hypothetical protein
MASAIILIVFGILAAPAAIALFRQTLGWRTVAFYCVTLVAVFASTIGFKFGPMPDAASFAKAPAGEQLESSRCEEALTLAERAGVVLDRSGGRLVVQRNAWAGLPEEVRTALHGCAESVRGPERQGEPVQLIER